MPQNFVPPGVPNAQQIAPLSVDGTPVTDLLTALTLDRPNATSRYLPAHRYWSSARRNNGDPNKDIIEIDLNTKHLINYIGFDISHFPLVCVVEYFDPITQDWLPVPNIFGGGTQIAIGESIPAIVNTQSLGHGQSPCQNPFHHGHGHWHQFPLAIRPTETSRIRLVLSRTNGGQGPVDFRGKDLAYPVGIRNLDIGYKVLEAGDVPRGSDDPRYLTEREDFASTTDMLGSAVTFRMRETRAKDLLSGGVWKCAPQPVPFAVVPFYIDARDEQGHARVVDRFYMDPLYSDASVNIYYSTDTPDGTFPATDTPLTYPMSSLEGEANPIPTLDGLVFPDAASMIVLDPAYLQWQPSRDWWLGVVIQPGFDSADATARTIFTVDSGDVSLAYDGAGNIVYTYGDQTLTQPVSFTSNSNLGIVIEGGETVNLIVNDDSGTSADASQSGDPGTVSVIHQAVIGDTASTFFTLESLVLKNLPLADGDAEGFFADPMGYVLRPRWRRIPDTTTMNALLRFSPKFLSGRQYGTRPGTNPTGLVGGPGDIYTNLVWHPINRDYKLRRGMYDIPVTKAKFFKLEFTNLTAQPYDTYVPVTRTVSVFPSAVVRTWQTGVNSSNYTQDRDGGRMNGLIGSQILRYSDQNSTIPPSVTRNSDYSPTEALYTDDPTVAARLRALNPMYGFSQWQGPYQPPRFTDVTRHVYEQIEVKHTNKVAYFVGLRSLSMYRLDYTVDDDTAEYIDLYHDDANLQSNGWSRAGDGDLVTGDLPDGSTTRPPGVLVPLPTSTPNVVESKVFSSHREVSAIQYASQQSDPVQLLQTPDFNTYAEDGSPALDPWVGVGDAEISASDAFNTDIGTNVLVQRHGQFNPLEPVTTVTTTAEPGHWYDIEATYPSWLALEDSGVTFADLETIEVPETIVTIPEAPYVPGGINYNATVTPASQGRVYAASRVITETALNAPLYLQIISAGQSDSDQSSLAEIEVNPLPGTVTEVYVGYTLGDTGVSTGRLTWSEVEDGEITSINLWADADGTYTWSQVAHGEETIYPDLAVRLIQKVETGDSWYVDNISLYEEAIVWEFSRDGGRTFYSTFDIRNNPRGVFVFPALPSDDTTGGKKLCYRVTGYREGLHLHALAIRPWYGDVFSGIPHREQGDQGSPLLAAHDQYQEIRKDPYFRLWSNPIPQEWWYYYKQILMLDSESTVVPTTAPTPPYLQDSLVVAPILGVFLERSLVYDPSLLE